MARKKKKDPAREAGRAAGAAVGSGAGNAVAGRSGPDNTNRLQRALLDITNSDKVSAGMGDKNAQVREEQRKKKKEKRKPPRSRMAKP